MDFLSDFLTSFLGQLQSPTLGFLIGGMVVASVGSRLSIPDPVYKFIVFMLLMKVGLTGGQAYPRIQSDGDSFARSVCHNQ